MSVLQGLLGDYGPCEDSSSVPIDLLPSVSNTEGPTNEKGPESNHQESEPQAMETETTSDERKETVIKDITCNKSMGEADRLISLAKQYIEPPISDPADGVLTAKLQKFHQLRKQNKTFNGNLFNSKSFANPNILAKLVDYFNLEETGSNCHPSVFSLAPFNAEDFGAAIEQQQNQRAIERQEAQYNTAQISDSRGNSKRPANSRNRRR